MNAQLLSILIAVAFLVLVIGGMAVMITKFRRNVPLGRALILQQSGGDLRVTFGATMILPMVNSAEELDLTLRTIAIDARGREALVTKDGARAEVRALFHVIVRTDPSDVIKVARSLGCAAANDPKRVQEHFAPKFLEALKVVTAHFATDQLGPSMQMSYKDEVIAVIGTDLNGFTLDDVVIEQVTVGQK